MVHLASVPVTTDCGASFAGQQVTRETRRSRSAGQSPISQPSTSSAPAKKEEPPDGARNGQLESSGSDIARLHTVTGLTNGPAYRFQTRAVRKRCCGYNGYAQNSDNLTCSLPSTMVTVTPSV